MTDDTKQPVQELTTTMQKPAKTRRPSKRMAEAIRLLGTGECKTQRAAAERVGMSETHLCEMLRKPEIRVFMDRYARSTIAYGSVRAANRIVELIDAGSEHVSLDASKHTLAIEGIKPAVEPQSLAQAQPVAGWVVDLSEPGGINIRITSPLPRRDDSEMIDVTPNDKS